MYEAEFLPALLTMKGKYSWGSPHVVGVQVMHEEHRGLDRMQGSMFIRLHTRALAREFMQMFEGERANTRYLRCAWANREMSTPHRRYADQDLEIGKARFLEDVWNIPDEARRRHAYEQDRLRREAERERQRQERAAARAAAAQAQGP